MKCPILFSGKNKKNIKLSSAELAQRMVKVKCYWAFAIQLTFTTLWANSADDRLLFALYFPKIGFGISCKLSP